MANSTEELAYDDDGIGRGPGEVVCVDGEFLVPGREGVRRVDIYVDGDSVARVEATDEGIAVWLYGPQQVHGPGAMLVPHGRKARSRPVPTDAEQLVEA